MSNKNKSVEEVVEEFDSKFFIGGINAHGEEKPLLFPAKCEVRDWLRETLTERDQTSQEREREIVEEILKMIDYESGFDRRTNEHKPNPFDKGCISAADNFTRRIKAIAQKYNITLTNPNKD